MLALGPLVGRLHRIVGIAFGRSARGATPPDKGVGGRAAQAGAYLERRRPKGQFPPGAAGSAVRRVATGQDREGFIGAWRVR
jgi:hypothetical protein